MAEIEKVFKAYDIRGTYPDQIDEDLAWRVGHATAQFLRTKLSGYERGQSAGSKVVVSYDMRPHSDSLVKALIEGISSAGLNCINIGMCDTPMIYFAINHLGACGGIQVTASHNPIQYNGFKISGPQAKPVGENTGLSEIKHIVKNLKRMPDSANLGSVQEIDLWEEYRKHVHKFLKLDKKLKVAVDASNGMAGKMIPKVFDNVENLEIIPMNFELGQGFAHSPNPLEESSTEPVRKKVVEIGADLGICLDGDADRCVFIDEKGITSRCDITTAWLATDFLKDNPGSAIVYDLRSTKALPEAIRAAGGVPRRERVGHSFMKKAMAETHAVFGGELSGHSYFRDNFHADSAAIVFAKAISVLSSDNKPLSELVEPFKKYFHSGEINFKVADKEAKMREIEEKFSDSEIDHLDGVTCTYEDWWCNVRPSNTEPYLRLSLEAHSEEAMKMRLKEVEAILGTPIEE